MDTQSLQNKLQKGKNNENKPQIIQAEGAQFLGEEEGNENAVQPSESQQDTFEPQFSEQQMGEQPRRQLRGREPNNNFAVQNSGKSQRLNGQSNVQFEPDQDQQGQGENAEFTPDDGTESGDLLTAETDQGETLDQEETEENGQSTQEQGEVSS